MLSGESGWLRSEQRRALKGRSKAPLTGEVRKVAEPRSSVAGLGLKLSHGEANLEVNHVERLEQDQLFSSKYRENVLQVLERYIA